MGFYLNRQTLTEVTYYSIENGNRHWVIYTVPENMIFQDPLLFIEPIVLGHRILWSLKRASGTVQQTLWMDEVLPQSQSLPLDHTFMRNVNLFLFPGDEVGLYLDSATYNAQLQATRIQ